MKNLFLAGATGMVGTNFLEWLIETGKIDEFKIKALVHKSNPIIFHENIHYDNQAYEMIRESDCAILAASNAGGAQYVQDNPWDHMYDNLTMNMRLLNDIVETKTIKRVVFISSSVVYQPEKVACAEQDIDFNMSPNEYHCGYALMMRYLEKMCRVIYDRYRIQFIIARASNIYGKYDKFDPSRSNFIPALIRKAVDKQDPFEVWGSPDVTRDVIYAKDFVSYIYSLFKREDIKFNRFNVSSGVGITVEQVVACILNEIDFNPHEIKYLFDKPTTDKYRVLNNHKLGMVLGRLPHYQFKDGIKETIEWWKENKNTWMK